VRRLRRGVLVALAAALAGCYDFHKTVPVGPEPIPIPAEVSVTVQYVQPNGCIAAQRCGDLVVFFGSWMQPSGALPLTPDPSSHVWTGIATHVPVNFPPNGQPYELRIYDPYLQDSPVVRYTGERLTFGGQLLTRIQEPGGHGEAALAYVDQNGQGHNPF